MSTNRNVRDKFRYSDDKLLYDYNDTIILYESIELLEALRNKIKKQNSKYAERRNGMLIFDLVVKYCIYAETLGATINGFEQSNKHTNPSSTIVLRYLRDFEVPEVGKLFQKIASPNYKNLTDDVREKLVYVFGYQKLDKSKIDKTISKTFHLLEEIAGVYLFYVKSYNAYKHGHRVWYGYDLNTQKSNSLFYVGREYKSNNYEMDHIPLDDDIVPDYIFPRSNDCRQLFELLLHNNKNLSKGENNYKFLE
jgi:hypothetical protein